MSRTRELVFSKPGEAGLVERALGPPTDDQLIVRSELSAISAGTEMLFYRGEVPVGAQVDESLPAYTGAVKYPLAYGYCNVGRVEETGERVFTFRGHAEAHCVDRSEVVAVPEHRSTERAVLLPLMETAVALVMDGQAMIGERVAVVGQGTVGALTTALLSHAAVEELAVVDPLENRRTAALPLCASEPDCYANVDQLKSQFDLVYELSGRADGLDAALSLLGYAGRLVLGSWYGTKPTSVKLGALHRNQNTIHISQVSRIAPRHSGRFSKSRRLHVAETWLDRMPVERLISHRVPFAEAPAVYPMLDERPEECLQVVVTYP